MWKGQSRHPQKSKQPLVFDADNDAKNAPEETRFAFAKFISPNTANRLQGAAPEPGRVNNLRAQFEKRHVDGDQPVETTTRQTSTGELLPTTDYDSTDNVLTYNTYKQPRNPNLSQTPQQTTGGKKKAKQQHRDQLQKQLDASETELLKQQQVNEYLRQQLAAVQKLNNVPKDNQQTVEHARQQWNVEVAQSSVVPTQAPTDTTASELATVKQMLVTLMQKQAAKEDQNAAGSYQQSDEIRQLKEQVQKQEELLRVDNFQQKQLLEQDVLKSRTAEAAIASQPAYPVETLTQKQTQTQVLTSNREPIQTFVTTSNFAVATPVTQPTQRPFRNQTPSTTMVYTANRTNDNARQTDAYLTPTRDYDECFTEAASKALCDQIIAECSPEKSRNLTVYQLPLKQIKSAPGCAKYEVTVGNTLVLNHVQEKTIIVVGATGAGKTTLINGMVNYLFGVTWQHDYRLRLIREPQAQSQAHSQTQAIAAYIIPQYKGSRVPYKLTILDTPGFGDTQGIKRDKEITEQMRNFFQSVDGVSEVNAIGFVTQASLARLTPSQKYIFDSILATFGKDITDNITLLITFADAQEPPVLAAVKEAQIPFKNYDKFNNSALYVLPEKNNVMSFNMMFWQLGEASFDMFFVRLKGATTKSLQLTKQVLNERRQLETVLNGLLPRVKMALNKMEESRKQRVCLEQHKTDIAANENFKMKITVPKIKKVDTPPGLYVTNCMQCNLTCHDGCAYADNGDKYKCSAMNNQDNSSLAACKVCQQHCSWQLHKNMSFKFEVYTVEEVRDSDEMMQKYQDASNAKLTVEQVIDRMGEEYDEIKRDLFKMIVEARSCLKRLNEIAMKRNPLTMVDYIDQLIESEQREMQPGFKDRVKALNDTKQEAIMLEKIAKPGMNVDDVVNAVLQQTQEQSY